MSFRKWIPQHIRLKFKLFQRWASDKRNGNFELFSNNLKTEVQYPFHFSLSQEIKKNHSHAEKLFNLRLACEKINNLEIKPQSAFSFWHEIGAPTKENGFKKGRNIIEDQLTTDYGGGLCQLSGIIYHASLITNMFIWERHPHSRDIYTDATRFTPLGSDATVVYGYKDLRVINLYSFPIVLSFEVLEEQIEITISSPKEIKTSEIIFDITNHKEYITVLTIDEQGSEIATSKYQL